MAKIKVTRTYGPIHFEDLDPHRFEDLIRELIYDYKDWQSIEATGRSGSDEGFDIRAYEKVEIISPVENEGDEDLQEVHPMEGNLWMIQGKREKEIGPRKIKKYLAEIDIKYPPYGYILAASANFSKQSYDVFREELRVKGVMEFYLWGKAELEDMLHLPKNDRILFTFFGFSLVSKRKSKTTELRSTINIKNRIFKTIGEGINFHESILIRDLKDTHYPFEDGYKDFKKWPRWKEFIAFENHPLGLWCQIYRYFAYIDTEKKEWDITSELDLIHYRIKEQDPRVRQEKEELIKGVWDFFPRAYQGYYEKDGLVKYADIVLVDDKGDVFYNMPHLYVDFLKEKGPFAGYRRTLKINNKEIYLSDDYKRIKVFPDELKKQQYGKIYKDKQIKFDPQSLEQFKKYGQINTLYECGGKYEFLDQKDIIQVSDINQESDENFIQITHKFKIRINKYLDGMGDEFGYRRIIEQQLGRKYDDNEEINIYEFKRVYKWELEKAGMA